MQASYTDIDVPTKPKLNISLIQQEYKFALPKLYNNSFHRFSHPKRKKEKKGQIPDPHIEIHVSSSRNLVT
uniref:Uncharacterized protein n=1 Tax=Arundo donax TaxID=35708 RepID=A0A0A9FCA9_ARUDO